MNVRPAGREACNCASPYNSILERLDAMEAEILAVQATANSAMGVANAQAGAAASSASAVAASATAAGNAAISAASDASDALTQATAAAGSADDAADSAADALTALQTIEGTIASVLASDLGGKVDKLTTAGFYLYMHNGSTQGEVQPVVAPTAATIPIRDSDGRMQAADPASGATDKTLVTANWVSQTGGSAPNNLVHRTANEQIDGRKSTAFVNNNFCEVDAFTTSRAGWHKLFVIKSSQRWMGKLILSKVSNSYGLARAAYKEIFIYIETSSSGAMYWLKNIGSGSFAIKLTYDGSEWAIWTNCTAYTRHYFQLESMCYEWGVNDSIYHVTPTWNTVVTEPAAADYQVYIDTVSNP